MIIKLIKKILLQHEQGQGQGQRRPVLPKFGEWNVNDPASADGYTVVFTKARDEKKAKATIGHSPPPPPPSSINKGLAPTRSRNQSYDHSKVLHFKLIFGAQEYLQYN